MAFQSVTIEILLGFSSRLRIVSMCCSSVHALRHRHRPANRVRSSQDHANNPDWETYRWPKMTEKPAVDFLTCKIVGSDDDVDFINTVLNPGTLFCPFSLKS